MGTQIRKNVGFTLIEILVVVSIISLLSSVVFASISSVRATARDTQRYSDLTQLKFALELYREVKGWYPVTLVGGTPIKDRNPNYAGGEFYSVCYYAQQPSPKGTSGSGGYIPNLAPNYIDILPTDPQGCNAYKGYIYVSNGFDYKLLTTGAEKGTQCVSGEKFFDPKPGRSTKNCTIYTPGAFYKDSSGNPLATCGSTVAGCHW